MMRKSSCRSSPLEVMVNDSPYTVQFDRDLSRIVSPHLTSTLILRVLMGMIYALSLSEGACLTMILRSYSLWGLIILVLFR